MDEDHTGRFEDASCVMPGMTITLDIFTSGAVMNPPLTIALVVAQVGGGNRSQQWISWVGPIVGAAIAAFLYSDALLASLGAKRPH